jgi:hypothetical protein
MKESDVRLQHVVFGPSSYYHHFGCPDIEILLKHFRSGINVTPHG